MHHPRTDEGHMSASSLYRARKSGLGTGAQTEPAVHSLCCGGVTDFSGLLGSVPHLHARLHSVFNQRHQVGLHHSHHIILHWHRKHVCGAAGTRLGQQTVHGTCVQTSPKTQRPVEEDTRTGRCCSLRNNHNFNIY